MMPPAPIRARNSRDVVRLMGSLRLESVRETAALFGDVSGKRISGAAVPSATRHSVSRALNGCESNPLYRVVGWFVLARRLGIPKSRLQRVLDWLQEVLDAVYDDAPPEPLAEVLDRDAELDGRDDLPRLRAVRGDRTAMLELMEVTREEMAHDRTVLARLRAEVTVYG